jgi:antitoxin component YwqK of YwqJK toxin-antitoxin module
MGANHTKANNSRGQGIKYYKTGEIEYQGECKDIIDCEIMNKVTVCGQGIKYYKTGEIEYQGGWKDGMPYGSGASYTSTGNKIYEGECKNGKSHGHGIMYYDNGNMKYKGNFKSGMKSGNGVEYAQSGKKEYRGQYENDTLKQSVKYVVYAGRNKVTMIHTSVICEEEYSESDESPILHI